VIGRLTGRIARRLPHEVLLDVGGVGYRVSIPLSTFCSLPVDGDATSLEIYTLVRDDAILLYGFGSLAEKDVFEALLSVSGVGPKVALAILSGLAPEEVAKVVEAGDAPGLRAIPGVGRKLAERIVLELKEKLADEPVPISSAAGTKPELVAREALVELGYSISEAEQALAETDPDLPPEERVRQALRAA
jgi:holliday junction DNA helicase RuvA